MTRKVILTITVFALGFAPRLTAADPFEFKDGDRVVFLGSTLVEREQKYGSWELLLTLLNKEKSVTFRNLGWSGDTVWGEARNGFDQAPKGFERLVAETKRQKPTVIAICYGQNESFAGPAGVAKFAEQLEKLIDAVAVANARIILLTPTPFVQTNPNSEVAFPDTATVDRNNKNLDLYVAKTVEIAKKRKIDLVDLHARVKNLARIGMLANVTSNGMHWNGFGYLTLAPYLATDYPPALKGEGWWKMIEPRAVEELRVAIVDKNRLFFHQWRPQNETYLFLFRKHEQGNNAKDIPAFDPLIAKAEQEIAELKKRIK